MRVLAVFGVPKLAPKWPQSGPKLTQIGTKLIPNWSQICVLGAALPSKHCLHVICFYCDIRSQLTLTSGSNFDRPTDRPTEDEDEDEDEDQICHAPPGSYRALAPF